MANMPSVKGNLRIKMDAVQTTRHPMDANPPSFETVWATLQEVAELQKETDRQMKESSARLERDIGYLNNRFGEMAEHLVAPGIHDRFNDLGYDFDAVAPGGYVIRNEKKEVIAEVDILLENESYIMAVEVKAKPHLKDIQHHIKRLEIFRQHRDKHRDTRKIHGAIVGAIFGNKEKEAAIEAGLFVLEQSGDTMKIDIPKGFIPGEW
jgi:hypothetical protein